MKTIEVLGKYRVTYPDGNTQEKYLIDHSVYESADKEQLRVLFAKGMYFTTKSPMFEAVSTGILNLPPAQGGAKEVKIEKI